ncbi:MAG: hypothetical protein QXG32_00695 [Candidatus Bathyarchaeia archaeon]
MRTEAEVRRKKLELEENLRMLVPSLSAAIICAQLEILEWVLERSEDCDEWLK